MYIPRKTCAGLVALLAFAATGCAILKPEPSGLGEDIVVSSSEPPSFEAQDVDDKEIASDLGAPVDDEGLGVQWELQKIYSDSVRGSVITIKVHNKNDVPLPVDAIKEPTLERANGNGGWSKVSLLPYDPVANADVAAPGLDEPLGAGAAANLQYRFDVAPANLWNSRLHIGNVTWVGELNL